MTIRGFTIVEVVMVVLIVALAASIALPAGNNDTAVRLESAAAEVAAAVRFARDEAIRTGVAHGVEQQTASNQLRLYRLDGGGTPLFDVHHPVTRQPWHILLDTAPAFPGVGIAGSMTWRGTCDTDGEILFRADGTPSCRDPSTSLLRQGALTLTYQNRSRTVTVDGFTARVHVP